jgi:hypothetical protein
MVVSDTDQLPVRSVSGGRSSFEGESSPPEQEAERRRPIAAMALPVIRWTDMRVPLSGETTDGAAPRSLGSTKGNSEATVGGTATVSAHVLRAEGLE